MPFPSNYKADNKYYKCSYKSILIINKMILIKEMSKMNSSEFYLWFRFTDVNQFGAFFPGTKQ